MFRLGETLRVDAFDRLAAATMDAAPAEDETGPQTVLAEETVDDEEVEDPVDEGEPGEADPKRRARHGRPPSRWLRSLKAEELRIWMKTIEPQEAGVSGMTYWTHLTRDHSFDPEKIRGLTVTEQAKLHAAAHDGY